jgi:hypothetical protein
VERIRHRLPRYRFSTARLLRPGRLVQTAGRDGAPWPDHYALELFDHPIWFRRRDARGPRTWRDCAVLGSPYRREVVDGTGELALDFLVALQPLLERKVGVWTNNDLSWWDPGQTICVLAAAGLKSERASRFGFRPVRNGIAGVQDPAIARMAPAGAAAAGGWTSIQAGAIEASGSLGRRPQQFALRRSNRVHQGGIG